MRSLKFHPDYIRSLMRDKDVYDYELDRGCSIDERIERASERLNSPAFQIAVPGRRKRGDSFIHIPLSWEDKLFLRHITQKIRVLYRVRPANRISIVRQICTLLKSDAPLRILRTDVKNFYRSISIDSLLKKIHKDGFLRYQESKSIDILLRGTQSPLTKGLPWGLSISSELAELAMQDFDRSVWEMEGLFYYRRFVDDVIAISAASKAPLLPWFTRSLPEPLKLGIEKTSEVVESFPTSGAHSTEFQYLGFAFTRDLSMKKKTKVVKVTVGIAPSKLERLKKRIDLSIEKFKEDRDVNDLFGRIKMLTGNYHIKKSGHPEPIPVGIFYNYRFIDPSKDLLELDKYLKSRLIALRIFLRANGGGGGAVSKPLSLSFMRGFEKPIIHRFSKERISKLRSAWLYA